MLIPPLLAWLVKQFPLMQIADMFVTQVPLSGRGAQVLDSWPMVVLEEP